QATRRYATRCRGTTPPRSRSLRTDRTRSAETSGLGRARPEEVSVSVTPGSLDHRETRGPTGTPCWLRRVRRAPTALRLEATRRPSRSRPSLAPTRDQAQVRRGGCPRVEAIPDGSPRGTHATARR